jgi:hypothetical protein
MIEERIDQKRGCGWRQAGGLYLVCKGEAVKCGKLPIPLTICPTCSGGIHFARSWTWVDGKALLGDRLCQALNPMYCAGCLLGPAIGRSGLLWIGEQFYKTTADWMKEAVEQGVSRRIPAVPRDFKPGRTVVLVAHKKAIKELCSICSGTGVDTTKPEGNSHCTACDRGVVYTPGIFSAFIPTAVEYVTKGDETDEQIEAFEKRGITPVKVVQDSGRHIVDPIRDTE